jgi:transcriptional regulator with XRE-family HTH domain
MNTNTRKKIKDAEDVLLKSLGATPNFGEMLQALRTCDGVTQVALSKLLKTSRQDISDIERGRKSVSPERAAKIAKALGYSPEQFIAQALQDQIDRGNLKFKVRVEAA